MEFVLKPEVFVIDDVLMIMSLTLQGTLQVHPSFSAAGDCCVFIFIFLNILFHVDRLTLLFARIQV